MRDATGRKISQVVKRSDVAAYLLDRADQYGDDNPCWIALADAARAVMRGDVEEAERTGALEEGLYDRLARMTEPDGRRTAQPDGPVGGGPRRREIMHRKLVETMIEVFKREASGVLAEISQPLGFEEFCRRLDDVVERKGRKT